MPLLRAGEFLNMGRSAPSRLFSCRSSQPLFTEFVRGAATQQNSFPLLPQFCLLQKKEIAGSGEKHARFGY
jgi:hypothetical protein